MRSIGGVRVWKAELETDRIILCKTKIQTHQSKRLRISRVGLHVAASTDSNDELAGRRRQRRALRRPWLLRFSAAGLSMTSVCLKSRRRFNSCPQTILKDAYWQLLYRYVFHRLKTPFLPITVNRKWPNTTEIDYQSRESWISLSLCVLVLDLQWKFSLGI